MLNLFAFSSYLTKSINEDINNLPINKRIDELGKVNILVNAAGIL